MTRSYLKEVEPYASAAEIQRSLRFTNWVSTITTYEYDGGTRLVFAVRPTLYHRLRCAIDTRYAFILQTKIEYQLINRLPEGIVAEILIVA